MPAYIARYPGQYVRPGRAFRPGEYHLSALLPIMATVRHDVITPHSRARVATEDSISAQAKTGPAGESPAPKAAFRDVFGVPEFRALWLGQILSVGGDQLARVALTVLVYDRTGLALLAAVTFAASIVPTFLGGVMLSGLADRLPRRQVMIACDLIRCALVLVMTIRGVPVGLLVVLLFAVTLVGAPFSSARAALFPDVLPGDRFVLGTAVTITTNQLAQVAGFLVGGALVNFLGIRTSLVVDAGTFLLSALIVRLGTRWRPAARERTRASNHPVAGLVAGARLVFANPALRIPMYFGWLAAFYNAPEGIAVPLARSLGGGRSPSAWCWPPRRSGLWPAPSRSAAWSARTGGCGAWGRSPWPRAACWCCSRSTPGCPPRWPSWRRRGSSPASSSRRPRPSSARRRRTSAARRSAWPRAG